MDLSEFRVIQLVNAQSTEAPVQLEQLQPMAAQPLANQEAGEPWRQEEQRADVSLISRKNMNTKALLSLLHFLLTETEKCLCAKCERKVEEFYWPCDQRSSSLYPKEVQKTGFE